MRPRHTDVVEALQAKIPFVAPEALERRVGRPIELRLGANESPFGPSKKAVLAMQQQAISAQNYGDPEGYLVRQELSRQLHIPMDNIVLGAGIDELLGQACRVFAAPAEGVVTTLGSYPTFDYGAEGCGNKVHRVPYREERADLAALVEKVWETGAKILYLANPDNPSGSVHPWSAIEEVRRALPSQCVLLLDEAYIEFAFEKIPFSPEDPQVIRFRTFSKAHGLAGMRIAYAMGHAEHIQAFNKIRSHFAVNVVAQAGALASLGDLEHIASVVRQTAAGRSEMMSQFQAWGFRPLPSATNFLTVDVGSKSLAEKILSRLLEHGVFIRKPGLPPLDSCIRVTIGRPEQRMAFAEIFSGLRRDL